MAFVVSVYLVYSSFGIACPFLWGHHGYHGATYMLRALMTLRFHVVTPCNWAGYDFPPRFTWYFHHPIGYHHLLWPLILVFGNHEWVARGLAAAGGLLVIAALWALVKRWWSREAALLACAAWVALPIVTSFSILSDPMLPAMACCIYTVDIYLRYLEEPTRRRLKLACLAYVVGGLLMWEAYFQAFFHGAHALLLLMTKRGRKAKVEGTKWNASLAWILSTGISASATMAFHLLFTWKMGMLGDFHGSYNQRHSAEIHYVISKHKEWFELLYGKPLVWIGGIWIAVFLLRALVGKARRHDQAVLIFALINTLYVYLFAEGSSVHEYRVFWYSSFFVLAVTDLVGDFFFATRNVLNKWPRVALVGASSVAAISVIGYFAVEGPHALHNLVESREMMGTHGLPGYNADYPKQLFAMEVAKRTGPEDFVLIHVNLPRRIEFYYYADRSGDDIRTLAQLPSFEKTHKRIVVLMAAFPTGSERKLMLELLKKHPGYVFDRYLMIDMRSDVPGIHEYEFRPQPASLGYRWFVSHKYPPMKPVEVAGAFSICADAALGLPPPQGLPAPVMPPAAASESGVCWHDFELLRGDAAGAAAWLERVRSTLVRPAGSAPLALGDVGRVIGLQLKRRAGAELWLALSRPLPAGTVLRWRLAPATGSAKPVAGEVAIEAIPANAPAGWVVVVPMQFWVGVGEWRLSIEVGARGQALKGGQVPEPLGRAEFGKVEVR